jgi:hypothetical protein
MNNPMVCSWLCEVQQSFAIKVFKEVLSCEQNLYNEKINLGACNSPMKLVDE